MSMIRTYQLVCDKPGCTEAYSANYSDLTSAYRQRVGARAEGWSVGRSSGRDFCPAHSRRRPSAILHTDQHDGSAP